MAVLLVGRKIALSKFRVKKMSIQERDAVNGIYYAMGKSKSKSKSFLLREC